MWNMEYQDVRVNGLVHFLERHRHMPREVWTILDHSFRLLESKEALYESYDEEEVDYILEQIRGTAELGYECFAGKALDFDIEHYLDLRQEAQSALREDDLEEAEAALTEAAGMFPEDPDLSLMLAKLYLGTVYSGRMRLEKLESRQIVFYIRKKGDSTMSHQYSLRQRKRLELYFRCLTASCLKGTLQNYYVAYEFGLMERLVRKSVIRDVLKTWSIQDAKSLKRKIRWLLDDGGREEYLAAAGSLFMIRAGQ